MKKKTLFFFFLLQCFINLSCSSDNYSESSQVFEDLTATVKGQVSCQTMNDGFVFEIELDEPINVSAQTSLKSIGITNLPENLKMEGTKILISVRPAEFPNGTCVTTFSPEYFFENTKASLTP